MKSVVYSSSAAKRRVNLTLTERNVEQARQYTPNLSATVDALLAEFVAREMLARQEKRALYALVSEAWNQFEEFHGSFADEHSTL
jgi:antitoxin CcdA